MYIAFCSFSDVRFIVHLLIVKVSIASYCVVLCYCTYSSYFLMAVYVNINQWICICVCSGPVSLQESLVSSLEEQYFILSTKWQQSATTACIFVSFCIKNKKQTWLCFSSHRWLFMFSIWTDRTTVKQAVFIVFYSYMQSVYKLSTFTCVIHSETNPRLVL